MSTTDGLADTAAPLDAAWRDNPLLRRLLRTYLAFGRTADQLVTDAGLDRRTDVSRWLDERSGPRKPAPARLGGPGLPPLDESPGTYVHDS